MRFRCPSTVDSNRCDKLRFHPGWHVHRSSPHSTHTWGRLADRRETYETTAPWITWTWLSFDRETRITGRMRMKMTCCICGKTEVIRPRIPRWGPVPQPPNGIHPERLAAIERHSHPDRRDRADWALPFRNPVGGLDLGMLQRVAETAVMEHQMENPPDAD